jgi:hypothetical protein
MDNGDSVRHYEMDLPVLSLSDWGSQLRLCIFFFHRNVLMDPEDRGQPCSVENPGDIKAIDTRKSRNGVTLKLTTKPRQFKAMGTIMTDTG